MEEMRSTALAYYSNLSAEQKSMARIAFVELDVDGDGTISRGELIAFLGDDEVLAAAVFSQLDLNGNCELDYEEFLTFYYMIMSDRLTHCGACGANLLGVYFTCVQCFHRAGDGTYDLCCACFGNKKFSGHHRGAIFCDIYTLIRSKSRYAQKNASYLEGTLVGEIAKIGIHQSQLEAQEREARLAEEITALRSQSLRLQAQERETRLAYEIGALRSQSLVAQEREACLAEEIRALRSQSVRFQTEAAVAIRAHDDLKRETTQGKKRRMILDVANIISNVTSVGASCSIM